MTPATALRGAWAAARRVLRRAFMTPAQAQSRIFSALVAKPMHSIELAAATELPPGALYPALLRMERVGLIASKWMAGPAPRRRIYWLRALHRTPIADAPSPETTQ